MEEMQPKAKARGMLQPLYNKNNNKSKHSKLFNNFKYTTYAWSYKMEYDYFITEQLYKHVEDYVFQQYDAKFTTK